MSENCFATLRAILALPETQLCSGEKNVLMFLRISQGENEWTWVGLAKIIEGVGLLERTVEKHLATLKRRGFIIRRNPVPGEPRSKHTKVVEPIPSKPSLKTPSHRTPVLEDTCPTGHPLPVLGDGREVSCVTGKRSLKHHETSLPSPTAPDQLAADKEGPTPPANNVTAGGSLNSTPPPAETTPAAGGSVREPNPVYACYVRFNELWKAVTKEDYPEAGKSRGMGEIKALLGGGQTADQIIAAAGAMMRGWYYQNGQADLPCLRKNFVKLLTQARQGPQQPQQQDQSDEDDGKMTEEECQAAVARYEARVASGEIQRTVVPPIEAPLTRWRKNASAAAQVIPAAG